MEQPIKKKKKFSLCQISPSASSTRDVGTRLSDLCPFLLLFVAVVFIVDQTPSRLSVSHREKVALATH